MNPKCPHYISPRYYVDPATDKGYEGSAMCSETDKYCMVEYGEPDSCEEYNDYLKELKEEE